MEFTLTLGNKLATDVRLLERNRLRGWIAIIREGKGFIEEANVSGNIEPILFTINSFTGDNIQIDLGDEVEFSLRKISNRLIAENILKVPSTLSTLYVSHLFLPYQIIRMLYFFFSLVHSTKYSPWSCSITCAIDNNG